MPRDTSVTKYTMTVTVSLVPFNRYGEQVETVTNLTMERQFEKLSYIQMAEILAQIDGLGMTP